MKNKTKITALAGGVGGAKLALGLAMSLPSDSLTIIVNTGDDFEYWGLKICPDLDTVCYTLAGISNEVSGWGQKDDSWNVYENIKKLGGPDWFHIGDKDIAIHLERTQLLKEGQKLSSIVREFCSRWGIIHQVLPMSDDPVSTIVDTYDGSKLPFQEYFVHQKFAPVVKGFHFEGIQSAKPGPGVLDSIQDSDAVIICPSNPWVSIDPILSVQGINSALIDKKVVGISPIVGGQALKGPAAKIFTELGIKPSALAVAEHYLGIIDCLVIDTVDEVLETEINSLNIKTLAVNTIMNTIGSKIRLAQDVLNFIEKE